MLAADGDRERDADRRPDRVAAADPVPHREAIIRMDAEFVHGRGIDGNGSEMLAGCRRAEPQLDPLARRQRIAAGLQRGEGLGADDEQGAGRVCIDEQVGELAAVDVRDERHPRPTGGISVQRLDCHRGTEVRAADADVDHQGKCLAGTRFDAPIADRSGEIEHAFALGVHQRVNVRAADHRAAVLQAGDGARCAAPPCPR